MWCKPMNITGYVRPALMTLLLLTILTGVVYPLAVTGIAQWLFPSQANGSLIVQNGKVIGSSLIGQPFDDPRYFWSRPSATSPFPYNAAASSGSNLGATNPALLKAVQDRIAALKAADPDNPAPVPVDLVTASGSGLDPISARLPRNTRPDVSPGPVGWTNRSSAGWWECTPPVGSSACWANRG